MKLLRWLEENFEEYILMAILCYISLMTFIQVVMRYVFGNSLAWSEESMRYLFIWMIFLGFSLGVKRNKHIIIGAFKNSLPPKGQFIVTILADLLFMTFCIVLAVYGLEIVRSFYSFPQYSPALQIPIYVVYAAAPMGFILTSLRLVWKVIATVKAGPAKLHKDEEFQL